MEHEEFPSDNLGHSPCPNNGFQTDKYPKTNINLNIPDTIAEQSSGELSGNSMEAPSVLTECSVREHKETSNCNQSVKGDDSSISGTIIAVDNSYIINCERKLLESSSSDEEKSSEFENKSIESGFFIEIPRKLGLANDTLSTPPSALRKQISILTNEMAEAHEFHDLELKVLKDEEGLNADIQNNLQWADKYSALMDLYTTLKNEYDEYRREQEKLQYKTADYLETLCSQIEASDSSLNFSGASFVSFNTEIKSSTMMGEVSEVEATIAHDGTMLVNDPLSITNDGVFKTPMQTPLKSAKKLFPQDASIRKENPVIKEIKNVKDLIAKHNKGMQLNSEYNIQLLDIESTLYDKIKDVDNLEQRLFKIEDFSSMLQNEHERIASVLEKENKVLKENVSKKSEQLEELTEKLFTEIIALKPSLKDSLTDAPGTKLLAVFIETIMESCKSIQDELLTKYSSEKAEWEAHKKVELTTIENLQNQIKSLNEQLLAQQEQMKEFEDFKMTYEGLKEKIAEAENLILTRDEEIRILQSHDSNIRQTREDLATAKETVSKLESQLSLAESEKKEMESRCQKMEEMITNLKNEMDAKENLLLDLSSVRSDNENLKLFKEQSEAIIADLKTQLTIAQTEGLENKEEFRLKNLLETLDESKRTLMDLLSKSPTCFDNGEDTGLKLVEDIGKNLSDSGFLSDSENTKFLSLFTNTVIDCCKSVREKLNTEFGNERADWEAKRSGDLTVIEDLRKEHEEKLFEITQERNECKKFCDTLKEQLSEAQNIISSRDEEIIALKNQENLLKQVKGELALAEESVLKLKAQLLTMETEKIEIEKRFLELEEANANLQTVINTKEAIVKDLENFKCLYEKVQSEFENLKEQNQEIQLISSNLKTQLEMARENQMNSELKIEELLKEIDVIKDKQSNGLVCLLKALQDSDRELKNIFSDTQTRFEAPDENISKLITEILESNPSLNEENVIRILSFYVETIFETCMKLQKEFDEKFLSERNTWETRKNNDFLLIENLENQIRTLNEKNESQNAMLSEMNELKNLYNHLQEKLSEAENEISSRDREIVELQSQENNLKQTVDRLSEADQNLDKLKSQLTSCEAEKTNLETRCQELEAGKESLNMEINMLKNLEKSNAFYERVQIENEDLKQRVLKSEEIMADLRVELEQAKEEQNRNKEKVEELIKEIEELNKDECFSPLVKAMEESKKNLNNIFSDVELCGDMPHDAISKLVTETIEANPSLKETKGPEILSIFTETVLENRKDVLDTLNKKFNCEKDEWKTAEIDLIEDLKNQIKSLNEAQESKNVEQENLRNVCEGLESRLTEAENIIASRNEEILGLQSQELALKHVKEALSLVEAEVLELKAQLSSSENQKSELQNEKANLQKLYEGAQAQISESENIISIRNEEIRILQSQDLALKQTKDDLAAAEAEVHQLKTQLSSTESQKLDLEKENIRLQELYERAQAQVSDSENVISAHNEVVKTYENEINEIRENLNAADETIEKLKSQIKLGETEVQELQNRCQKLEEDNLNLKAEIQSKEEALKGLEISNSSYEKLQSENETLKQKILETEQIIIDLKGELERAIDEQNRSLNKINELVQEVEKLRNEKDDVMKTMEESRKSLADALSNVQSDETMPGDRITKFISKKTEFYKREGSKEIVSVFMEVITESCKGVQNELMKKLNGEKVEWENEKNLIENQVKVLTEKNNEHEAKLSEMHVEKDDLKRLYDALADQMSEKEKIINSCEEEIRVLQSHEAALKQTKGELASADAAIAKLETQLSTAQNEISEMECRCQKLEKHKSNLLIEIETQETRIKDLEISNKQAENKNNDLNQEIMQLGEVVENLKGCLELNKEEKKNKELRLNELTKEMESLQKEKERLQSLEEEKKNLADVLLDIQSSLDMPSDTLSKLASGHLKNRKIFSERLNTFMKAQVEDLVMENKNLKFGNENLRERVKELSKISEMANSQLKEGTGLNNSLHLKNKSGKNMDLCVRRLDKLEEINQNLVELLMRILTMTEFPDIEKLKLCSVRDFPNIMKKVVAHINNVESKLSDLKAENAKLDEECDSYAKTIKDLKKEAVAVWKANKEKTESMQAEISRLKEEKSALENEKQELLAKIAKMDTECQKLKSNSKAEGSLHTCTCGNELKIINDLKRTILIKEQKILELQDLVNHNAKYKTQIEYLENALEREKKKIREEKQKNKKLQNELNEATKTQKTEDKKSDDNQMLDELRMRGSISGGIVQEFVDKEKMRKLAKDIEILKELCRTRYAELKRLEAENAALRNATPKNSNQMDSPLRTRGYNTRSKNPTRDLWKTEIIGKENSAL